MGQTFGIDRAGRLGQVAQVELGRAAKVICVIHGAQKRCEAPPRRVALERIFESALLSVDRN
ncbi:MAG: hypothetical protein ACPHTD_07730 [Gammaproteobacteria bacterium]